MPTFLRFLCLTALLLAPGCATIGTPVASMVVGGVELPAGRPGLQPALFP